VDRPPAGVKENAARWWMGGVVARKVSVAAVEKG